MTAAASNVVFLPAPAPFRGEADRRRNTADGSALLLLRLGGHAAVVENFGELYGMALNRLVEARLQNCLREGDSLLQISGDEFVITLAPSGERDDLAGVARRLIEKASGEYALDAVHMRVQASVGICETEIAAVDTEKAVQQARSALSQLDANTGQADYRFSNPQPLKCC